MAFIRNTKLISMFLIACAMNSSCSNSESLNSSSTSQWVQIGPQGGFISSVAFHPTQEGTVWASGDDGTGLYKSTNGGSSWSLVQTGSQNQSTYSLRFDPNNPSKIFAPNHFGRGMLLSADGGNTWSASQAGLPISGSASQALNDLAISPTNSNNVFIATDNGLYKSTDGGVSFNLNSTSLSGSVGVRSLGFRQDGVLFIGKADGCLGYSGDGGGTWTQMLAPNAISLDVILFTSSSLYLGYRNAAIFRLNQTSFSGGLVNDPTQSGSIQNTNRLAMAVFSGASAASDLVYVGTSGASTINSSQYGLFKSTNGGTNWTQATNGMSGNSIASVAVDPQNSNHVVVGSGLGKGVCLSTNAASTWTCVSQGIYATASLGLAQDPANANHLLASNTACGGFSQNYETFNGGSAWTSFPDPVADDGIFAFDIDPSNPLNILAGTCTKGIVRSTSGMGGNFSTVTLVAGQRVDRFVRDSSTTSHVYAVVPSGDSSHSLYFSSNSGASFSSVTGVSATNLNVHPSNSGEGIVTTSTDVFSSQDSFATLHSLGLGSFAGSEGGFIAVAFNPASPSEVLVGGASGGVYRTLNYNSAGTGVTWTKLSQSPVRAAAIRDIVIVNRNGRSVYYIAASAGDTGVSASSTSGLFRSTDGGQSWSSLTGGTNGASGLYPSSMIWRFLPSIAAPTTSFFAGMWSGGLNYLVDNQ